MAQAVRRAADLLGNSDYRVTFLQGEVFHLETLRERVIRKIRDVIDGINQEDEQKVRGGASGCQESVQRMSGARDIMKLFTSSKN